MPLKGYWYVVYGSHLPLNSLFCRLRVLNTVAFKESSAPVINVFAMIALAGYTLETVEKK